MSKQIVSNIARYLTQIVSGTNGIVLDDTLELASHSDTFRNDKIAYRMLLEFREFLGSYKEDHVNIKTLLNHPVGQALHLFFRNFPLTYREEHIHLTGSMTPEFIFPRLNELLHGPNKTIYEEKISQIYGPDSLPLNSVEDVERLVYLEEDEKFERYLKILYLPKLILISRQAHLDAAYDLARNLSRLYNVGFIRLKFTLVRTSQDSSESIPGLENLTSEDVILGLYEGFKKFQAEQPTFDFALSPSFRKERSFFDVSRFATRQEAFMAQVNILLAMLERHPELAPYLKDVDTVGDERDHYRKQDFFEFQPGFRKLHQYGFSIRSHHGETWRSLRLGIQAVDNAINIWHIDRLEHGISLGINPNYYLYSLMLRILERNQAGKALGPGIELQEIDEMQWRDQEAIPMKIRTGEVLTHQEIAEFDRVKFFTAREVEHYQHDVLNHLIHKGVTLTSLPSSNKRLTDSFPDFKDHPFSYWEKKGVKQNVGTDNYITLGTNFIREMVILLLSDSRDLKITKLLMVTTGENRRPYLSKLLWDMRARMGHQQ